MVTMKKISEEEMKKEKEAAKMLMGRLLFIERDKRGWSLDKVGESLGITGQSIHLQEIGTNEVRHHHLRRYSEIYEKPISYFYGEITDPKTIMIAKEAKDLPDDISVSLLHLMKSMNKALKSKAA